MRKEPMKRCEKYNCYGRCGVSNLKKPIDMHLWCYKIHTDTCDILRVLEKQDPNKQED